jgi:hypothetical protein
MDDQQGANRQGEEQRSGGGEAASKGINPVQHSERGINPVQHSEGRQPDETPGRGEGSGGGREGNAGGNG